MVGRALRMNGCKKLIKTEINLRTIVRKLVFTHSDVNGVNLVILLSTI